MRESSSVIIKGVAGHELGHEIDGSDAIGLLTCSCPHTKNNAMI